jgi:hypothetical protein
VNSIKQGKTPYSRLAEGEVNRNAVRFMACYGAEGMHIWCFMSFMIFFFK